MDDQRAVETPRGKRRWPRKLLLTLIGIVSLLVGGLAIVGEQYRGPRSLAEMTAMMPGVPIFPFADLAPNYRASQRLMAIPLYLARMRGIRQAEVVALLAPADRDFVLTWYAQSMPFQGWTPLGATETARSTRIFYQRGQEVVQLYIGPTVGGRRTPLQVLYFDGVSPQQMRELLAP